MTDKSLKKVNKGLVDRMIEVFDDKDKATKWFYLSNKTLGDKSPYDLYKEGKLDEIEVILWRIEYGVYS